MHHKHAKRSAQQLTALAARSLLLLLLLPQVDVLSRQAALAEVLQHRIADQEDVLQQLQAELEHVDAQRVGLSG
jgi:hypothetical protein